MESKTTSRLVLKMAGGVLGICLNIIFYVIIISFVIKASQLAYHFTYQVFGSVSVEADPGHDVEFQILKGESTMSIATKLENSSLIIDKYSFYVKTKLKQYNIMPGTYVLNTSMNYDEILDVITDISNSIAEEETLEEFENAQ